MVDWPDLNRQVLYGEPDLGLPKLALAKKRLQLINSEVELILLDGRIDASFTLPSSVSLVADCLDNYQSRFALERLLPSGVSLVHGGLSGDQGQVMTLKKGVSQSLEEIYSGLQQPSGPIPVTPDNVIIIAGLMVNEIFSTLFGAPKLLDRCLVVGLSDFHFSFLDVCHPLRDTYPAEIPCLFIL